MGHGGEGEEKVYIRYGQQIFKALALLSNAKNMKDK